MAAGNSTGTPSLTTELRRDLESQRPRRQNIYYINNSDFWKEKRGDFQQLAEQVARERRKSIVALGHIANYLFHGLDAYQPGIDILVDAHPHIGSNKLPAIVAAIRESIINHGGEVHFETFTGITRIIKINLV